MWRGRWRRKRWNMWVHPINITRPEFGIFSHIYPDLLKDEEKFHGFFKINVSNSTICHSWGDRKYENKTLTTGGRFHLKNYLQFLRYVL
jgi:hypothetical protein